MRLETEECTELSQTEEAEQRKCIKRPLNALREKEKIGSESRKIKFVIVRAQKGRAPLLCHYTSLNHKMWLKDKKSSGEEGEMREKTK